MGSAGRDTKDGPAFLDHGRDDFDHFRFIVSANDGSGLTDPRKWRWRGAGGDADTMRTLSEEMP